MIFKSADVYSKKKNMWVLKIFLSNDYINFKVNECGLLDLFDVAITDISAHRKVKQYRLKHLVQSTNLKLYIR